jgi:endoglucanase
VAAIIRKHLEPFCRVSRDGLGSLLAHKAGSGERPRVMVCAHMDEVGFMVQSITEKGFLRLQPLGGWSAESLAATRLWIHTRKGDLPAVIPAIPPHFKKAAEDKEKGEEILADVGTFTRQETMERGVMLGDLATPVGTWEYFGERIIAAKAWDDRAGCAALILAMEHLRACDHAATVVAAATVQEEMGSRGATTAVRVVQPDLAVILEAAPADDLPGIARDEPQGALGRGCQIRLYDPTTIVQRRFWEWARQLACDHGIEHQLAVRQSGSTDARPVHTAAGGIPTLILATPVRYIHAPIGLLHLSDLEATVSLVRLILEKLDGTLLSALPGFAPS